MKFKNRYILVISIFFISHQARSQDVVNLNTQISVKADNIILKDFINYLNQEFGIKTGYFNSIAAFNEKITIQIDNETFKNLLDTVFKPLGINYILINNKLILKEEIIEVKPTILQGSIFDQQTNNPLPYCAIQLKSNYKGCITDSKGRYYLELKNDELHDTVIFSMLGYTPDTIPVSYLLQWSEHRLFLKPAIFPIEGVEIKSSSGSFIQLGNKGFFPSGSVYMDTHGQQTALYVQNEQAMPGRIVSVSYFLSKKGNTSAPFRIRIYAKDSTGNYPGMDLLKEMIVVSPDINNGWYEINISRFDVSFPEDGAFIAMEGIYPDDFQQIYTGYDFVPGNAGYSEEYEIDDLDLVSYGQRLGYNRKGDNCTWHYSITGNWFQVNKTNFNAMIAIEVKYYDDEK